MLQSAFFRHAAGLAIAGLFAQPVLAACEADSGTARAALVELYTSEGCSSCPPAEKELKKLGMVLSAASSAASPAARRVVPLALHVDYWDSIEWRDPFAQAAFSQRQEWEVHANNHRTSYTPHFFVNGHEVQDWRADIDSNINLANGKPAPAQIRVRAEPGPGSVLKLKVDTTLLAEPDAARGPLQLFVAITESGITSHVKAGENSGATLNHDYVARNWIGPIAITGKNFSVNRTIATTPQLSRGNLNIVAFVQNAQTAEVLQAVGTGTCKTL